MKKLKDLCLGVLLNEGEEVFSLSSSEISSVTDVDMTSITVEFITEADNAQASTSVCQLPNGSYLLHSFENIDSEKFKKIADLN
jgi:hypothetical protein